MGQSERHRITTGLLAVWTLIMQTGEARTLQIFRRRFCNVLYRGEIFKSLSLNYSHNFLQSYTFSIISDMPVLLDKIESIPTSVIAM